MSGLAAESNRVLASWIKLEAPHGHAWLFLVVFLVIVGGPFIIERFKLPGIIGLLLGGLLIGPHGLGAVPASDTTVTALGQLGLLYLMFVAGLELDLDLVKRHRRSVIIASMLTFSFPMAASTTVGLALGYSGLASALLGSLMASHTLVVYPTIRGFGLGSDPAIAAGVGATVVTDTLALVVLAVVSGATVGHVTGPELASQVLIGFAILGTGCFVVLPRLARLALNVLGQSRPARYVFALVALLSAATLSEMVGIDGIVGAFFGGIALNRLVPRASSLMDRIEFFGSAVFIPVFLVSVGLILDPGVMADPDTLALAALFILACSGGKATAAMLTKPLLGYSWPQVGLFFSLTSPQAAATLAVTTIGQEIGLFGIDLVNAVLILILFSLVFSALTTNYFARRAQLPPPFAGGLGDRVLLVSGATPPSVGTINVAARLAAGDGGVVIPVVVIGRGQMLPPAEMIAALERSVFSVGPDIPVEVRRDRTLADGIVHAASSLACTCVVVADSDASALPDILAARDDAPVPILVVQGVPDQARRIVAVTNSDSHDESVRLVARRLNGRGGTVTTIAKSSTEELRDDDLVVMAIDVCEDLPQNLWASSVTMVR